MWGMDWAAMTWQLPVAILLLGVGGDMLVQGAASLAKRLRVSGLLIGVTLVGFGTSIPELITSVRAALVGSPGIAVGNVVGSNIANILLVLGVSALLFPIVTPREAFSRNGVMLAIATVVCVGVVLVGFLDRQLGAVLVALLFVYFVYIYFQDRRANARHGPAEVGHDKGTMNVWLALLLVVLGTGMVIYGARELVDTSIEFARDNNVSETIIGLTIVAIGTSLPELITSVMAAFRKETAIALGNILGSNIQNIFGILGVTAIVKPIPVPGEIVQLDIWVMTAATAALLFFAISNWRVSRFEGFLLLCAYAAYIGYLTYLAIGPFWLAGPSTATI